MGVSELYQQGLWLLFDFYNQSTSFYANIEKALQPQTQHNQ